MKSIMAVLALLALLAGTAAAWDNQEQEDRLRSYDQGREDAQAGFITSGGKDQSAYDTGYREQKQSDYQPPYQAPSPTYQGEDGE
jgi:hypothetical protein